MGKKVIIIGAGIAGLSAGCYLRMNGYDTEIFELHTTPGGLCTSWERGNYIFDGCIHILAGNGERGQTAKGDRQKNRPSKSEFPLSS